MIIQNGRYSINYYLFTSMTVLNEDMQLLENFKMKAFLVIKTNHFS